jgi:hypothetical protein
MAPLSPPRSPAKKKARLAQSTSTHRKKKIHRRIKKDDSASTLPRNKRKHAPGVPPATAALSTTPFGIHNPNSVTQSQGGAPTASYNVDINSSIKACLFESTNEADDIRAQVINARTPPTKLTISELAKLPKHMRQLFQPKFDTIYY